MTGNPRLAQDCRRRLVQQYGEVVHGIAPNRFSEKVAEQLAASRADDLDELSTSDLAGVCRAFEEIFEAETGKAFPDDPLRQLRHAIEAVLRSWSSERARTYRSLNAISDMIGTAVTVQIMVFGNTGPQSGSGVGFTRNPADGTDAFYVDFLCNAQGEDVVSGRHRAAGLDVLKRRAPSAHEALLAAKPLLEAEFRDMQDFEFTVEEGRLLMLQARSGKRTPLAALRIANDLVREGIATHSEALKTLEGLDLDAIEETKLCIPSDQQPLLSGTPASTGVVVGAAVFDPIRIADLKAANDTLILVRPSAETSDIAALVETDGLVTAEGARTSHAAVVARQLGKPCVVACSGLSIDASGRLAHFGSEIVEEGDIIAVDAASGRIFKGRYDIVRERPTALIDEIKAWSDTSKAGPVHRKRRQLSVQRHSSPGDGNQT
jgi:pyruvate,orthophosphate dikinase